MSAIVVNGVRREVQSPPDTPLLYVLRNDLELSSPQFGCGLAQCGSCSVLLDGREIRACITPLSAVEGKEITTVEGLGTPDALHVLQENFKEHHGLQCGFCTPGMITRAAKLLEEIPNPTEEEVRFGIAGNICRCTGYQNIVKSILSAASELNAAKEAAQ